MTGDRKWDARQNANGTWFVIDGGRLIGDYLTEPEARDIAGIDDIKAERDEAVKALKEISKGEGIYGMQAYEYKKIARTFLTSIKEQGNG